MNRFRKWLRERSRRTRWLIGAAAAVVLLFGVYRAYQLVAAGSHLRAATQAADRDDQAAARRHLEACLAEWPTSGEILFLLARAERRDGQLAAARKHLKQAAEAGWTAEAINMEQTLLRAVTGEFREVEPKVASWAALDTDERAVFYEVLVPGYMNRGDLEHARANLARWVEREPGRVQARLWQADVCERMGDTDEAIGAAQAAAAAAPDRADVRRRCGELLIDAHRPDEALPHFEAARRADPADAEVRFGVARCLFERGDSAEATKLTDELLAAEPGHPAMNRLRGQLAMQAGEFDRAERLFRQALRLAPADLECLNALAGLYDQMGRPADADTFRTAHQKATRDQEELRDTARTVARNPRDADLRYKAGVLMLRNGYTAEGVRWLESALAEQPTHEPSRKALADATRRSR